MLHELNKKENIGNARVTLKYYISLRLHLWLCVVAEHKWFDPEGSANDVGRQRKCGAR